jgi:toxin FitB
MKWKMKKWGDPEKINNFFRPRSVFTEPALTLCQISRDVVRWLDAQSEPGVWISSVTAAEIRLGIDMLSDGKRKAKLFEMAEEMLRDVFLEQCLPFDCEASVEYASIIAARSRKGRPISVEDAQIAAIALTYGLTLATRNTSDFLSIEGLKLVNPWSD